MGKSTHSNLGGLSGILHTWKGVVHEVTSEFLEASGEVKRDHWSLLVSGDAGRRNDESNVGYPTETPCWNLYTLRQ